MSSLTESFKTGLRIGVDLATKAVIAAAMTALPLLGVPGINFLFTWGVNWVVGKLMPHLEVFFVDKIIDIQIAAKKEAYEHARDELKIILRKAVRDPKEVEGASKDFDRTIDKLIRVRP